MSAERFVQEVRRVAREEARRTSPPLSHYRVVSKSPFTLEAFGSDHRLVEGEEDFSIARAIRIHAAVGDTIIVATDEHGDHVAVAAALPAASGPGGTGSGSGVVSVDDEVAADRTTTKGCVVHGDDPAIQRPSGFPSVEWIGNAEPVNAIDNDTWASPGVP